MTLVVVTEQDILNGKRGWSIACPVALATSRAFGRPMQATYAGITDGQCASYFPPFVSEWIHRYDAGLPVPRIWFYV